MSTFDAGIGQIRGELNSYDPVGLCTLQKPHDCLPMTVLEELDNARIGVSEVTRNLRQTNRFILGPDLGG